MAFATHWRTEFNDLYGITWKVDIQEDAYGGAVVDLVATGNPLTIEWSSMSDDYNEPIRPSKATVNVYSTTNFALVSLYSDQDFKYKMIVYNGSDIYWSGYLITGEYSEPYEEPSYQVSVTATDGLTYLKSIMYDDDGTYYNGRILESQIILDILAKIEVTTFTEFVNLYEESMNVTATDSPLDQIKIDVDIFKDMYCFDVLSEVLKKYNAVIIHTEGGLVIYRPEELTQATVYGRVFTTATAKTGTSFAPVQYINRTTVSNLIQLSGSVMMVKSPMKKITINQDYGYKDSWVETWEFKSEDWNRGASTFDNWTNVGTPEITRAVSQGIQEDKGVCLTAYNTYPTLSKYIKQTFGTYAVTSAADAMLFEFDYMFISDVVKAAEVFYVDVKTSTDSHYLYISDETYCAWDASANHVEITEAVAIGVSEWKTFKRLIIGLPAAGTYEIRFYCLDNAVGTTKILFRNVKFYSADADVDTEMKTYGIVKEFGGDILGYHTESGNTIITNIKQVVTKKYTIVNALIGRTSELKYMIGDVADSGLDNVIEQYAGSLMTYVTTLQYRVDKITISGTSGTADVLCDGVTREATFDTDPATTAGNFVLANANDYLAGGVVLTADTDTLVFTSNVLGAEFTGSTTITNTAGDLTGGVTLFTAASIVTTDYSTDWNTYTGTGGGRTSGAESKPLIELIGAEIGAQYARPKQLIQMNIQETNTTAPVLNIIGRVEDELNQVGGNNRTFVFNAGTLDVKQRRWNADIIEII